MSTRVSQIMASERYREKIRHNKKQIVKKTRKRSFPRHTKIQTPNGIRGNKATSATSA